MESKIKDHLFRIIFADILSETFIIDPSECCFEHSVFLFFTRMNEHERDIISNSSIGGSVRIPFKAQALSNENGEDNSLPKASDEK
ncbi:hypothetical protein HUJ05_000804 [Dendroctonus ponderosae]|nr:hypothetical protein HUJ05_000804 [Dendroctonus ponderosae]